MGDVITLHLGITVTNVAGNFDFWQAPYDCELLTGNLSSRLSGAAAAGITAAVELSFVPFASSTVAVGNLGASDRSRLLTAAFCSEATAGQSWFQAFDFARFIIRKSQQINFSGTVTSAASTLAHNLHLRVRALA